MLVYTAVVRMKMASRDSPAWSPAVGTAFEELGVSALLEMVHHLGEALKFLRVLSLLPTLESRCELSAVPSIMDSNILEL